MTSKDMAEAPPQTPAVLPRSSRRSRTRSPAAGHRPPAGRVGSTLEGPPPGQARGDTAPATP